MRVSVCNRQRGCAVDMAAVKRLVRGLAEFASAHMSESTPWQEVTIHLLDDAGIAPVNLAIMGHEGATDVITQRYEPIPGEPDGLTGELFVNVQYARTKAMRRAGWSVDREFALYLAHGCDHLSGADDHTPRERAAMRRRELAWLKRLPLTPLFQNDIL
jgi:metalloprotein, YbeY/UPF0054 family